MALNCFMLHHYSFWWPISDNLWGNCFGLTRSPCFYASGALLISYFWFEDRPVLMLCEGDMLSHVKTNNYTFTRHRMLRLRHCWPYLLQMLLVPTSRLFLLHVGRSSVFSQPALHDLDWHSPLVWLYNAKSTIPVAVISWSVSYTAESHLDRDCSGFSLSVHLVWTYHQYSKPKFMLDQINSPNWRYFMTFMIKFSPRLKQSALHSHCVTTRDTILGG
jgi:hypothetical protein